LQSSAHTGTTSADALRYEYAIRDHLGNTRLTFTDKNNNGRIDITTTASTNEVLQENHYYPFGMAMSGPWMDDAARNNLYQYNGKELNEDFGLNWYSYGVRWYDPFIGRFWSADPIIEKFPWATPYNYAENKVPNAIDLWGLQALVVNQTENADGRITQIGVSFQSQNGVQVNNNASVNGTPVTQNVLVLHTDSNGNTVSPPTTQDALNPLQLAASQNGTVTTAQNSSGFSDSNTVDYAPLDPAITTRTTIVAQVRTINGVQISGTPGGTDGRVTPVATLTGNLATRVAALQNANGGGALVDVSIQYSNQDYQNLSATAQAASIDNTLNPVVPTTVIGPPNPNMTFQPNNVPVPTQGVGGQPMGVHVSAQVVTPQ